MRVQILWTGARFEVGALDTAPSGRPQSAPARDFLESLNEGGTDKEPARRYKAMINRIQQHAERGPLLNKEQCRPIGDDMFEFKTPMGDRVYWFYDQRTRGRTVLTNGSIKADYKQASRRAKQLKRLWEHGN